MSGYNWSIIKHWKSARVVILSWLYITKCWKAWLFVGFCFHFPRYVWIPQALFQSQAHSNHHGGRCERRERSADLQGRKWEVEEVAISGTFFKSKTHIHTQVYVAILFIYLSVYCLFIEVKGLCLVSYPAVVQGCFTAEWVYFMFT